MRWLVAPVCLALAVTVALLAVDPGAAVRDAHAQGDPGRDQLEGTPTESPPEATDDEGAAEPREPETTPTHSPVAVTDDESATEPREPEVTPTEPPVEEEPEATPTPHPAPALEGPGVVEEESAEQEREQRQRRSPINDKPPPRPTGLSVTAVTITGTTATVSLGWTGVFGADRYRAQYMGGLVTSWSTVGDTTSTSTTVNTLTCGEAYSFRVLARGDGITWQVAWSGASDVVERTPGPCEKAPPPTGLAATGGAKRVSLSWDRVSGGYRYKVEQWDSSDRTWDEVSDSVSGSSYTVTGLACDRTYFFRVSTRGDGSPYSTMFGSPASFVSATTDGPCPKAPAPTGLSGTGGDEMVTLRWDAVPGAYRYKVEQGVSGGTWGVADSNVAETTYAATELECNMLYFFRVSTRGDGSPYSTTFGDSTSSERVRTGPCPTAPPPTGLRGTPGDRKVSLSWNAVPDGYRYRVQQAVSGGTWATVANDLAGTTYEATGLECNTLYFFRVSTRGDADGKPYSVAYGSPASTRVTPCPHAPAPIPSATAGEYSVSLTWNAVTDAAEYQVEQWVSGSTWFVAGTTTRTTYTRRGLECDKRYFFRVSTRGDGSPYSRTFGRPSSHVNATTTASCDPTVTISADPTTIDEGESITFTLTISTAPTTGLPVTVSVTDVGDCVAGTIPPRFTIPATETSYDFTVETEDDDEVAACTITATLADGNGYDLGRPASRSARVTVRDHHPTVTISANPTKVHAGGSIVFTVTSVPAPTKTITVSLDVGDSLLTGTVPGSVTVPRNGRSATFRVTTGDDETGTVTATIEADTSYAVGGSGSVEVAVVPGVTIATSPSSVEEGDTIEFTVTAAPAPSASLAVSVSVSQVGNFIPSTYRTTVTIPATGTKTLSVSTQDDAVVEDDGTVTATVLDGNGYVVRSPGTAPVTVEDNEPEVHITADPTTVTAGGTITFTVTGAPAPHTARTVRVNVTGGPLANTPPPTVTIPAGQGDESEATLSVVTADDAKGAVTATVQTQTGSGYTVGSPSSAEVTVTRDPVVTIVARQESITEGAMMEFLVTATPAPPEGTTLSVEVELGGVVSFLSDTANRTATLTQDEPSYTLSVMTADDSEVDGHGHVTATLTDGTGYRVGDSEEAQVFVWDNESPPLAPQNLGATGVVETAFTLKWDGVKHADWYLVERGTLQPGFTVSWALVTNGRVRHRTVDPQQLEVSGLQCGTSYSLRVRAEGDGVNTAPVPSNLAATWSPSPATSPCPQVSITYDGPAGWDPLVNPLPPSVEEGAILSFTVTADRTPRTEMTVGVSLRSGATGGMFLPVMPPTTATIMAGDTSGRLTFRTLDDSVYQAPGVVVVSLVDGDAYNLHPTLATEATAPVRDNDPALSAPTGLSVRPLPRRQALLTWEAVPDARGYVVEVKRETDDESEWKAHQAGNPRSVQPGTPGTTRLIDLDAIVVEEGRREGLAEATSYQFRVKATAGSGGESAFSQRLTLRDNPLLLGRGALAYGGDGQAILRWKPISGATYEIRYRKLLDYDNKPHSDKGWRLVASGYGPWQTTNVTVSTGPLTHTATISGLLNNAIYAIQVNYTASVSRGTTTGQSSVVSARDAYVWPSTQKPDSGSGPERVATFEFFGHWPANTYTFRVCSGRFPSRFAPQDWTFLVASAAEVWETWTDGLVTVTYSAEPCPSPRLDIAVKPARCLFPPCLVPVPMLDYTVTLRSHNEVRIVDPPFDTELISTPLHFCIVGAKACAPSPDYHLSERGDDNIRFVDILLNADHLEAADVPLPSELTFNVCTGGGNYTAFRRVVHEVGHALGLSGFDSIRTAYQDAHPYISDSVMNYDDRTGVPEPDCSPHPFDILAIAALYQDSQR